MMINLRISRFAQFALATALIAVLLESAPLAEARVDAGLLPASPAGVCPPAFGTFAPGNWPSVCWRPYRDDSPWNTPLPPSPRLASNSNAIVGRILGDMSAENQPNNLTVHVDGTSGEPTYYAQPSDPEYTLRCTMTRWGTCPLDGLTVRIPVGAATENGRVAKETNSDAYINQPDAHLTVVDQASGWEYDLWQVHRSPIRPEEGRELRFSWGGRTRIDGNGLGANGTGGTAAGFGSLAGRLRAEELIAGEVHHALAIVVGCSNGSFVAPAQSASPDGTCQKLKGLTNDNAPPLGTRLQLNLSPAEIDALPVPKWKKTLLIAASRYGLIVADTGTNAYFSLETESGLQYTSLGARGQFADPWQVFAAANGWPRRRQGEIADYPPAHYFGSMQNAADGMNWTERVWSRLRVIDPCVSARTC
jgi:hypothetical protein